MKKIIYGLLAFGPVLALAQAPSAVAGSLTSFGGTILTFINSTIIPILFAVAIVYFIYGVVKFVMNAGDEEKRKEGKQAMLWGIIGLVVIIAIFGLVTFLVNATGLTGTAIPGSLPQVPLQ